MTLPPHLSPLLPHVAAGDAAATLIQLAEGLKPEETGKQTSAAEVSTTRIWIERDPCEAAAEQGRHATEAFVDAAVRFIERWKQLRPHERAIRSARGDCGLLVAGSSSALGPIRPPEPVHVRVVPSPGSE